LTDPYPPQKLSIFRQLGVFIKPYKVTIALALFALITAAAISLAIPFAIKQIVDLGFLAHSQTDINGYFLVMLALITLMSIFSASRYYLVMWLGERIIADIRMALYRHILHMDTFFFETTPPGNVLSRLTADTTLVQAGVGSGLSLSLRSGITLIGSLFMLAVTSIELTSLILIVVPVILGPIIFYGRRVRHLSKINQDNIAKSNAIAGESLNAIPLIQAYNLEHYSSAQYNAATDIAFATARQRLKSRALLWSFTLFTIFAAVIGIIWIGTQFVTAGKLSAGELSQFLIYASMVASSTSSLSEVWGEVQRAAGALERILALLKQQPGLRLTNNPHPINTAHAGDINFANVSFNYPTRPEYPALQDFSLRINPGECVALVGPSGAGKSTVFQLLLRFYEPQHGTITLGNIDIKQADIHQLRELIGIVPQDTIIFAESVKENIKLGKLDATDDAIQQAAKAAAADEFIQRLPEDYATYLGEKGVRLSGGQRQRIAIARAVLKNSPVLLLDEATSALDTESERLVQQALSQLMQNRTTLIIAHRLSTVVKADRIVVMDHGRIIAIGKHDDLLKNCTLYARLAGLQFSETALLSNEK
jgi:ATP-binding cassette, subfamily B, bacterial